VPRRWGRLELLERIGAGTFGEVYRAFDTKLHREVAVKLLHLGKPEERSLDRVLNEARALAQVNHPNVVIVHDAEPWDGRVGLCMEFIRGKTLEQIVTTEGPRGASEAAVIGQELCQALAAVHGAGLLHRDVKAQNVMREDGGRIVLMDFGTGRAAADERGNPARLIGTPLCLAPEVLEGAKASVRSDIYSLGVLLYHLVTNDFPVRGKSHEELREAHRQGRVRRLRDVAPRLPSWFVRVVERAIAPNPQDRFATAGELEAALGRRWAIRPRHVLLAAAVVLAVGVAARMAWPHLFGVAVGPPRVVVLPLDAGIGVEPHVAYAVFDEIYQGLAMLDTIGVISQPSAVKVKSAGLTMPQVAARLKVDAVITGTIAQVGDQLDVKLRVFRGGSDVSSWAGSFQAARATLGSLRRDSAISISNVIDVDVSDRILQRLNRPATANSQAYDAYLRGRYLLARGGISDFENARIEFERTISLESSVAPAHAALARLYVDMGGGGRTEWERLGELARASATQALALDQDSAEAHAVLGHVAFLLDWDWQRAETAYLRAIALKPSYDYARQCYAHYLAARGRVDRALNELREVHQLDPYSETTEIDIVPLLQYARRFGDAETLAQSVRNRTPNSFKVHTQLGRIFSATGRFDAAIEEFERLRASAIGSAYVDAEIASAHAGAGRVLEAQAILDRLTARTASEEIPPELFALIYIKLGRFDDAFRHLDEAIQFKSRRILWLKVDPRWDPLRSDPRFDDRVKRLGL
jgi:serine/threonine-protein kinase